MSEGKNCVPVVEFNSVTAYRGKTKVVDQFSAKIDQGNHTAIIGPNGSGKSTFIQLLTKQLYPLASEDDTPPIRVFGKERWNLKELRRRIGIVSSKMEYEIAHNLKSGKLKGLDVAISGFFSSMQLFNYQEIRPEMKRKAQNILEEVKAGYLSNRYFSRMSAGEKRRVLFARALVTDPDMLVLDEPTTALDIVAREKCLRLIREITASGATVIIVTHHLEEIIPEIKNVILLKDGSVAYSGTKENVLTSLHLSEVFDYPVELHSNGSGYRAEL